MENNNSGEHKMASLKQLKSAERTAAQQRQIISQLNAVVKDVERCENTIATLKMELAQVNEKHQGPRTTRQDISYLSGLLDCAKKKLAWEKQLASLQKRTPTILQEMAALLNDPQAPPPTPLRMEILQALQKLQAAMERLQSAKPE
jgi:hypothetical protein